MPMSKPLENNLAPPLEVPPTSTPAAFVEFSVATKLWQIILHLLLCHLLSHLPSVVIGGPGTTVVVDESLFSRRKNHQGRALPQKWVFGRISRETRESFMYAVPDRSARTLLPIIQ